MLRVKERQGSPYWQIVGTVNGQRVRQSSGTSDKRTAEAEAAHLEARLRREAHYGPEHETTFGDAALAYIEGRQADNKPVISPPYLRLLIERYGKRTLASFSPGEVVDIAQRLHPAAGNATRNRHGIAPFMAVYNHAVARKLAPPMRVKRLKEAPAATVSVDRAWIDAVRAELDDAHVRAMVLLMFETGMRIGTALALTTGMLDAGSRTLTVPAAHLKNDEPHTFILTSAMADELASLPATGKGRRDASRLFGFVWRTGVYKHLRRACKAAGVPYVPPHQSGRHSFATTYIVDHQIDPVTVAELGGWKDVSMLMKRYPHAREAKLRSVVDRVSRAGTKPVLKRVK